MIKVKNNKKYYYNIGEKVNGIIITHQCVLNSKKAYKYKCPICGYDCGTYYKKGEFHNEHMVYENNLKSGAGCVICSKNGFVSPQINSIHALYPSVEQFLINKKDAYKYAPHSTSLLKCKCPDCNREYERQCNKIVYYGVPCVCGDGFSYAEKFVFDVLKQANISFTTQYQFSSSNFRYDFFLEEYNIIIEVNGIQHYKQKWKRNEEENDIKKKEIALLNGIKEKNYIELDCRNSNLNFIKESILNSALNNLLNCKNIDFVKCSEFALNNLCKEVSQLWQKGESIKTISEKLKLHKHTIISYLKQGNDVGWCDYKVGDGMRRYPNEQRIKNLYKNKGEI